MGKVFDVDLELFRGLRKLLRVMEHLNLAISHQQQLIENCRQVISKSTLPSDQLLDKDGEGGEDALSYEKKLRLLELRLQKVIEIRDRLQSGLLEINLFLK